MVISEKAAIRDTDLHRTGMASQHRRKGMIGMGRP